MNVEEKLRSMSMDEFYHLCNRLAREMGFRVRNGVYREDTVVIDAYMPVPGRDIRYILVFVRRDLLTAEDVKELVDFETLQIRWMIVTTGEVAQDARELIPENMEVTLMDGRELVRLVTEFGIFREERSSGSYLPSVGELDNLIEWAEEFYRSGNYDKALEYVNQAEAVKNTPTVIKLKSRILIAKGRYEEALSLLKSLLMSNVRDDEAWFLMGMALEQMGIDEDAEEAYGQCVRFNPRNVGCWLNRGNLLFSMGKYDESLLCYDNALKVRQDIPNAWNNRGVVLKYKGNYDEAMRSYNSALKYDPNFAQAYLNKAILFYEMRRYEEAENAIYQYLEREESEDAYLLLANIYMKRAMLGKAEEMARKALALNPASAEARRLLAHIRDENAPSSGVAESIDALMQMLSGDDMEPVRDILLAAKIHAQRGELEEAKSKLAEAKRALVSHLEEISLRRAMLEDVKELANELGQELPESVDTMTLEELRSLRSELIQNARRDERLKHAKEELLSSVDSIESQLLNAGVMTPEIESAIAEVRELIAQGDFTDAIDRLLSVSASLEREQIKEMRRFLAGDTRELLREAGKEVPDGLESMSLEEIKALRKDAIASMRGGDGGLREMVNFLSGATASASATLSVKSEIIGDIHELAAYLDEEVPENLEELSVEELKSIRKELIERLKQGSVVEEEEEYPGQVSHLLYELDMKERIPDVDDRYSNNALGLVALESGDYREAVRRFRRALAIDPGFREAEFNLAHALYLLGEVDEARLHLKNIGLAEDFFEKTSDETV